MTIEELKRPERLDEDRMEALKILFPEAFPEGKFHRGAFLQSLEVSGDGNGLSDLFYGLNWPGKDAARKAAFPRFTKTIAPQENLQAGAFESCGVIIDGNNLEIMKILLKSYSNRIKMIYIDPPYNTGNDFIYKDNYRMSDAEYISRTQQADDLGRLVSNPRTNGKFHTNWLNMMYPRLKLARELLRDDGVIYISVDENELYNLKLVMDEIFGSENFIAQINWQKRYTRSNNTVGFTTVVEYILAYSKSESFEPKLLPRDDAADSRYSNPDNDPRGPWKAMSFLNPLSPEERPNLCYPIKNPNTGEIIVPKRKAWRSSKSTFDKYVEERRVYWGSDGKSGSPSIKQYLSDARGLTPITFFSHEYAGNTDTANTEIVSLFGDKVFDTPKPTLLIKRLMEHTLDSQDLILDFFAGSGTTGAACINYNAENGTKHSFILVQEKEVVEPTSPARKAGYNFISEITLDRVKKSIEKSPQKMLILHYTLSESNILKFGATNVSGLADLSKLNFGVSSLKEDYKTQDVLTELMLLEGFPLDSHIEQAPDFDDVVYVVTHPERSYRLLVCLSTDTLSDATVEEAAKYPKDTFVCLESSLNDQLKLRLADAVENVKTL